MKLAKQILAHARLHESAPAIAYSGGVATYGTLAHMIEAAVVILETLRLPPRTSIMIDVRNPLQHTVLILALALLGYPSASLGSTFSVEKAGVLPGLLLSDRDLALGSIRRLAVDDRWFAHDPARPVDYSRLSNLPGFSSSDEIVRYVYSSGTTGFPKCVALTERVLELRLFHTFITTVSGQGTAGLNMLGFSTIAGIMAPLLTLPAGMLLCFANGNAEAMAMVRLFNVSMLSVAVVQLDGILRLIADQPPPPSLRLVAVSGSKLPARLLNEARARLCTNIVMGYGSTEVGSMTNATAPVLERYEGSAGYPHPWVELQAVDTDGAEVPAGTDGYLRARSAEMASYAADSGDATENFVDGWFYPGDIGRIHPDGLVTITGRATEVINRGGVIVAPELIEEVLRADPSVRDVAVVGAPINGIEQIWAAVVSDGPIDANAIAERAYPKLNEKVPDRIVRVDAIPRNENGKVTRGALRDVLMARLST